jgi:two-component system LytT family response regulator
VTSDSRKIDVCSYEEHALRAFEVHALDYLLKPVDDARFAAAVNRVRKLLNSASKELVTERILKLLGRDSEQYASRFALRTGTRVQIVLVEDIEWIGAAGDYAELHTRNTSHLLRETMASLEQKLDPKTFLRIHRSRIVRTNRIQSLRSIENHEYILKLSDGSEHRSSRTYADRLEAWLASGRG